MFDRYYKQKEGKNPLFTSFKMFVIPKHYLRKYTFYFDR